MNRNLLAVSWAMPPLLLPRALQISRLLKQGSQLGWSTTVVTVDPASLGKSVPLDADLERPYAEHYTTVRVTSWERTLLHRVVFRVAPFLKHMPDEKQVWVPPAYHAARKLLSKQKFDALISFAQPWSSHLVALRLHRKTGIPWIAHFSDPWTAGTHTALSPWAAWLAKRWEAQIVREATHLVFVTPEALDATMARFPAELKKKASVVPHGYDTSVMNRIEMTSTPRKELRVVHAGHFYGARSPETFLKALSELNQSTPLAGVLRIRFIGYVPPDFLEKAKRLGLGGCVDALGPQSYLRALQELQQADVLLLIEAAAPTNLYFPSKLVDYLLFKKPILGLTPAKGSSADLLKQLQCPVVDPDNTEGIRNALARLIEQKQAGSLTVSADFSRIAQTFDIQNTAKQFEDILKDVLMTSGGR